MRVLKREFPMLMVCILLLQFASPPMVIEQQAFGGKKVAMTQNMYALMPERFSVDDLLKIKKNPLGEDKKIKKVKLS